MINCYIFNFQQLSNYLIFIFTLCNCFNFCFLLNNGLALTPPKGWMQWERFRCNVDCDDDPFNCVSENLMQSIGIFRDHVVQ